MVMESGFYCSNCLAQLAILSTTRAERYYCDNCDERFTAAEALVSEDVRVEFVREKKK